jgi:hypothetical protein
MATCASIPNGSTYESRDTIRLFIELPRDIYPFENKEVTPVSGNAGLAYISNGGLPGQIPREQPGCWSTYYEFVGSGQFDLKVKPAVEGIPDYVVHFVVRGV